MSSRATPKSKHHVAARHIDLKNRNALTRRGFTVVGGSGERGKTWYFDVRKPDGSCAYGLSTRDVMHLAGLFY